MDIGFTPCPASKFGEIEEMLDFQSESSWFDPDHFTPEWDPGDVRKLWCYEKFDAKNDWTESGYTLLVYELETSWVHLYSWGA